MSTSRNTPEQQECRHNWLYVPNLSGARPYWQCDICMKFTEEQPPQRLDDLRYGREV